MWTSPRPHRPHAPRQLKCIDCHNHFLTQSNNLNCERCPECRKKYHSKYVTEWRKRNRGKRFQGFDSLTAQGRKVSQDKRETSKISGEALLTILYDPDEQGGFRKGAQLAGGCRWDMLEQGSFTPGTRYSFRGREYVVIWKAGSRQEEFRVK